MPFRIEGVESIIHTRYENIGKTASVPNKKQLFILRKQVVQLQTLKWKGGIFSVYLCKLYICCETDTFDYFYVCGWSINRVHSHIPSDI